MMIKKRIVILIVIILLVAVYFTFTKIWLLGVFFLFVYLYVFLYTKLKMGRHIGKKVWLWKICIITLILVFVVLIKSLVFEVFAIPTGSMENTLLPGDVILVNKMNYGPRLPRSPIDIPWVNLLFYKKVGYYQQNQWDYKRLPGNTKIKKGETVKSHTFIHNYYFMMGDNRHNSAESRIRGFVPDECIVGKVALVLFNYYNGKFRWNRFFKKIE